MLWRKESPSHLQLKQLSSWRSFACRVVLADHISARLRPGGAYAGRRNLSWRSAALYRESGLVLRRRAVIHRPSSQGLLRGRNQTSAHVASPSVSHPEATEGPGTNCQISTTRSGLPRAAPRDAAIQLAAGRGHAQPHWRRQFLEGRLCARKKSFAGFAQADTARGAYEERCANARFEYTHRLADSRRRHAARHARAGQAPRTAPISN
jgi:hypothetical protein